jgi:hypothetical protein
MQRTSYVLMDELCADRAKVWNCEDGLEVRVMGWTSERWSVRVIDAMDELWADRAMVWIGWSSN